VYDVPGQPNPYWNRRVQMASVMAEQVPAGSVSFYYDASFVKSNNGVIVSSITLNFGAAGSATLTPASPVQTINLSGSGILNFIISVSYVYGLSFTNNGQVQVGSSSAPYSRTTNLGRVAAPIPNENFWLSSKYPFQGYDESQAYYGKVKVSIWWKLDANNNIVPGIKKPIIIVDGIDALDERKDTAIYDLFRYYNESNVRVNFADQLRTQGFDIIVMDQPGYTHQQPTLNDPSIAYCIQCRPTQTQTNLTFMVVGIIYSAMPTHWKN